MESEKVPKHVRDFLSSCSDETFTDLKTCLREFQEAFMEAWKVVNVIIIDMTLTE